MANCTTKNLAWIFLLFYHDFGIVGSNFNHMLVHKQIFGINVTYEYLFCTTYDVFLVIPMVSLTFAMNLMMLVTVT